MSVKMYGPAFTEEGEIVERDVPEADVVAYERDGYVKGSLPPGAALAPRPRPGITAHDKPADEPKQGPLPDDFPGRAALEKADINTYAQLRKAGDVTELEGIGEATAAKIEDALKG